MASSVAETGERPTVLIVGACCLDRILTVDKFPAPDAKVRTTGQDECGGGNAANTATAMALLAKSKCFQPTTTRSSQSSSNDDDDDFSLRIKLVSKLGDDSIAMDLLERLQTAGVDTTFVRQVPHTTTSVTTVIVDTSEHTRTCLHTPGSCGELTQDDIQSMMESNSSLLDASVIHVHSDGRHTQAAKYLALHARQRCIPLSVDIEKDRHSKDFDWLLGHSTLVFTNQGQMTEYLDRLERSWTQAQPHKSPWVSRPTIGRAFHVSSQRLNTYLKVLEPSAFLTRWFAMPEKSVVITQGDKGVFLVQSHQVIPETVPKSGVDHCNDVCVAYFKDDHYGGILQDTTDTNCDGQQSRMVTANYCVWAVGTLQNAQVVDTTGAGDAFIAGYLLSSLTSRPTLDTIKPSLQMGAWVSGRKLAGSGAQSALPTASDLEQSLGSTFGEVQDALQREISSFRFDD